MVGVKYDISEAYYRIKVKNEDRLKLLHTTGDDAYYIGNVLPMGVRVSTLEAVMHTVRCGINR